MTKEKNPFIFNKKLECYKRIKLYYDKHPVDSINFLFIVKMLNWRLKKSFVRDVDYGVNFYNYIDEKTNLLDRCKKHEKMLRYMRVKYPIEY